MSGDGDFAAWFRLLETPGVGRETARRLLAACGSPAGVLQAEAATLRQVAGPTVAEALVRPAPEIAQRLDAALAWLGGGPQRHAIPLGHPAYPEPLLQTADPPLLLYLLGPLELLAQRSMAIVGSRHATAQGLDNARAFARELGRQGWLVVSGLALGIDAAAHEGALDAGATTLAVMGTGPDRVYPARHHDLAQRIVETGGGLLTEYPPGIAALAPHFPQRNRIIAGLARGTLVVEAALRSGSLITARLASEAGREVFALPGSIHAPQSQGCHALIQQGAKLVTSVPDMLDELPEPGSRAYSRARQAALPLDDPGPPPDPLLDALGDDPVTLDALLARTGWPVESLSARLLELELEGRVARLPGALFQRRHTG